MRGNLFRIVAATTLFLVAELSRATEFLIIPSPPTDATPLIQAAITAVGASGGSVYLPCGTWNVTGLVIPSNVSLRGDGDCSNLHVNTNAAAIDCKGASGVTIRDLRIT